MLEYVNKLGCYVRARPFPDSAVLSLSCVPPVLFPPSLNIYRHLLDSHLHYDNHSILVHTWAREPALIYCDDHFQFTHARIIGR